MELDGDATPRTESDSDPPRTGTFLLLFRRDAVDGLGLLEKPTALDVPVVDENGGGGRRCLRVPIVEGDGQPEWTEDPSISTGLGLSVLVPTRRIYAVDAAPMFVLRFGPWIGPVRARAQLAVGGADARSANPNLVGWAYGGGLLADTMLFHAGRFGLGAAVGYDAIGISFATQVAFASDAGSGYQGLIHGPRAGLSFALLPPIPPGRAFHARPDTASATLELFGAAAFSHDHSAATPALWIAVSVDSGR
jgi:hypothetical protein